MDDFLRRMDPMLAAAVIGHQVGKGLGKGLSLAPKVSIDLDADDADVGTNLVPDKLREEVQRCVPSLCFDDDGEAHVSVFIKFRGGIEKLKRPGVRIRSRAGEIVTATVHVCVIEDLVREGNVVFMELARPISAEKLSTTDPIGYPPLELEKGRSGLEDIGIPFPSPPGSEVPDGSGTCIAIIDGGLDFRHPAFWDNDENSGCRSSRVRALWDQTAEKGPSSCERGTAPQPWGYGLEYDMADIDDELALNDRSAFYSLVSHVATGLAGQHGTHVAGIAAGGYVTTTKGINRLGVAPRAEIIAVVTPASSGRALGGMTELADAVAYAFERAGSLPCVVNISMNDNLGPHDGTSLVEQFIDKLLETPQRAVVVSAGNSNQDNIHACGLISDVTDIMFVVPNAFDSNSVTQSVAIEIWYPHAEQMEILVTSPSGEDMTVVSPGARICEVLVHTTVLVTSVLGDARNGDNLIHLLFAGHDGGSVAGGCWRLRMRRGTRDLHARVNGRFHAWIERDKRTQMVRWVQGSQGQCTVGEPGTGRQVLTVGNHDRGTDSTPRKVIESTGCGPTRDGRMKPDLSAPGENIQSALRQNWNDEARGLVDVASGTSQAAPHVAGLIALLFSTARSAMTAEDVKCYLQARAEATDACALHPGFGAGAAQWRKARRP